MRQTTKSLAAQERARNPVCQVWLDSDFTAAGAAKNVDFRPDCKPEGPLFSAEFVCLSVCL